MELYTSSEARKKLGGMASSSFKKLVDSGKIRKITPPNKKQGLYMKEDVDKTAEAMQLFAEIYSVAQPEGKKEVVQVQNERELRETVAIAQQHFGERTHTLEKRLEWFHKAPEGDYVLKDKEVIVGYLSIQPFKPEALERIFTRKGNPDTQADDVEPFTPGKPLECYISGMVVKVGISEAQAKRYGMRLFMGMFDILLDLAKRGIDIRKLWVKSNTVSGIRICRNMGFTELGYVNTEQIGFVLDLEKSDFSPIRQYREVLQETNKIETRTT